MSVPLINPKDGKSAETRTATIADEGTVSSIVNMLGRRIGGLIVPTMTSAALTFQVSADGTTFKDLYHLLEDDEGSAAPVLASVEVSIPAGTHNVAYSPPPALQGWPYFRIVAGAGQTSGPIGITVVLTD